MQKYIISILIIFLVGCVSPHNKDSRYTEEQIASLHLDSTTILHIEIDSITMVDLNSYLKKQSFDFGSLVKEVKFIPLETTDKSLLGDIYKVLVTDSNIYIYDKFKGGGLVIFNSEGKFVKRLASGQGPEEINRLYDISYDKERNELVIYQHSFLLFFTSSGEFIRRERLPFGFYNFTVIPEGYVFKSLDNQGNEHLDLWEYYTLFITDKNFKLKSIAMPYPTNDVNYGGYNYLYNNNNTIKVTQRFTDTIYQYISETNQLKARYALDYSKKRLPERYLQGTYDEFHNAISQNDYFYNLGEYIDTEFHNVFFLRNDYIGLKTVIYRDKKSGNLIGGTNADFNMNEIPPLGFPIAASGNYFISVHIPNKNDSFLSNSSIISDEDKIKIKDLQEDDNPVLVFFQLKDF
jgi:hypothetical protein